MIIYDNLNPSDASMLCLSPDCGTQNVGRNGNSAMTSLTKNPHVIFTEEIAAHVCTFLSFYH